MKLIRTYRFIELMKTKRAIINDILFINIIFSILLCMYAGSLNAGTSKKTDLTQIIKSSDLIAQGVFSSVIAKWKGKKIMTESVFEINKIIKGTVFSSVVVESMGGTAMHPRLNTPVTMKVTNGTKFKEGDEAILFLRKISDKHYQVTGKAQGVIPIETNPQTGKKIAGIGIKKIHVPTTQKLVKSLYQASK